MRVPATFDQRQLQDLRRALLEPPTQLRPKTTVNTQRAESVGAVA